MKKKLMPNGRMVLLAKKGYEMKHTILENGNLLLSITAEQQEELRELGEDIQTDDAMYQFFEHMICNCDIDWIKPEDIGALTDAPILGITEQDDDGKITKLHNVWWYPAYVYNSPLAILRDEGEVTFEKAPE